MNGGMSEPQQTAPAPDPAPVSADGGALPNLVIIGGMKCGTSALHYCIDVHPQAAMSNPKEVNYFLSDPVEVDDLAATEAESNRMVNVEAGKWHNGADWYAAHFDSSAEVRGESSPAYTSPWSAGTAERMASVIPKAKLIYSVRDPLERMLSEYQHECLRGIERRGVDRALGEADNHYIARSRYWSRIQPFAERFPRENILIISQEELAADPRATLRTVFEFLGIDPSYWDERMERRWNTTANKDWRRRYVEKLRKLRIMRWTYRIPREWKWRLKGLVYRGEETKAERPELSPEVREEILGQLRPDIEEFRRWSGREFPDWPV